MRFAKRVNGRPGPRAEEFERLTPATQEMARWVDEYVRRKWGQEITITSMIRPEPPGTSHADGRAFDVRTWGWSREMIDDVVKATLGRYGVFRDPNRPGRLLASALYHDSGSGWHLHFASPA